MKLVYSDPKTGRTANVEVDANKAAMLIGMKVGDMLDGAILDMSGYKLKITGGSDKSGFPLIPSITGSIKTRMFALKSESGRNKGQYERTTVRGNTVSADTAQVNTVIVEYGSRSIDEILPPKAPKPKGEAKPDEAKK